MPFNESDLPEPAESGQEANRENVWDKIPPAEKDRLRKELKKDWEARGFIFFDNPRNVSPKSIEWRQSDFENWELVAVRRRRKYEEGQEVIDEDEGHNYPEFLIWKPSETENGGWEAKYNIEPRHLIELDENAQPDNDLIWIREELENVPKEKRGDELEYIKQNMSETLGDKYRREWVKKTSLLRKYRKEWAGRSLELLEREDLPMMEGWIKDSELVLEQYKAMGEMVKLKDPYTMIHECSIKVQTARDFYWALSERAHEDGDEEKKEEYTKKSIEAKKLADEYEAFIEAKKAYK